MTLVSLRWSCRLPSPHLRNDKLAGDQQRPQQVVSAVISHLVDGHLRKTLSFTGRRLKKRKRRRCGVFAALSLTCEPVRMMGLPKCSHMKDRAEAV